MKSYGSIHDHVNHNDTKNKEDAEDVQKSLLSEERKIRNASTSRRRHITSSLRRPSRRGSNSRRSFLAQSLPVDTSSGNRPIGTNLRKKGRYGGGGNKKSVLSKLFVDAKQSSQKSVRRSGINMGMNANAAIDNNSSDNHHFENNMKNVERSWLYTTLNHRSNAPSSKVFKRILAAIVLIDICFFVLSTTVMGKHHPQIFYQIEGFTSTLFLLEYMARLIVCTEGNTYGKYGPILGRLRYMITPHALLDAVATFPFFLELLFHINLPTTTYVRVFRLSRILKTETYSRAIASANRVLFYNREIITVSLVLCVGLILLTAVLLYFFRPPPDRVNDTSDFDSVLSTIYLSTLMLTGQGGPDGEDLPWYTKIMISVTSVFSVAMFAIPASMLTWGFEAEAERLASKARRKMENPNENDSLTTHSSSAYSWSSDDDSSMDTSDEEYQKIIAGGDDDDDHDDKETTSTGIPNEIEKKHSSSTTERLKESDVNVDEKSSALSKDGNDGEETKEEGGSKNAEQSEVESSSSSSSTDTSAAAIESPSKMETKDDKATDNHPNSMKSTDKDSPPSNNSQYQGPPLPPAITSPPQIVVLNTPGTLNPFLRPPPGNGNNNNLNRGINNANNNRGMPISQPSGTDLNAGISAMLHSLLPLIGRLLLITILSTGSSIFGFGDANSVYSPKPRQHFMLECINQRYEKDAVAMKQALKLIPSLNDIKKFKGRRGSRKLWTIMQSKRRKLLKKNLIGNNNTKKGKNESTISSPKDNPLYARTVIVMDIKTSGTEDPETMVQNLRDSVSFILDQYYDIQEARLDMGKELEVVLCVESPGGAVQDFGLAADQVTRLRNAGKDNDSELKNNDLKVTVCVDKIAASGGYMIACQAHPGQLFAAPFAIVGSIGVLRETINVHDVLKKYGIQPLLLKAGNAKVPLTNTAEVTPEALELVQQNLKRTHDEFKAVVAHAREGMIDSEDFEDVTNGDIFLGERAKSLGLVDRVITSDEYIHERLKAGDRVLRLHKYDKNRMGRSLSPLDLFLLRSSGMLGKMKSSLRVQNESFVRLRNSVFPILKVAGSIGMMKLLK